MADNTVLNLGSGGDTISTDDLGGGLKVQRVKTQFGADGSASDVADSDGARLPVKPHMAATATRTQVPDSATSGTLLASNANRKGAVITNDSSAVLYVALGSGPATAADYTVTIQPSGGVWTVPDCYTGIIVGIWASDPGDGGARVTELT